MQQVTGLEDHRLVTSVVVLEQPSATVHDGLNGITVGIVIGVPFGGETNLSLVQPLPSETNGSRRNDDLAVAHVAVLLQLPDFFGYGGLTFDVQRQYSSRHITPCSMNVVFYIQGAPLEP